MKRTKRQEEYSKYVLSDHWKVVASGIKDIYGHRCAICFSDDKIAVHHLNYDRKGCELFHDVIPLCRRCHTKVHHRRLIVMVVPDDEYDDHSKIIRRTGETTGIDLRIIKYSCLSVLAKMTKEYGGYIYRYLNNKDIDYPISLEDMKAYYDKADTK